MDLGVDCATAGWVDEGGVQEAAGQGGTPPPQENWLLGRQDLLDDDMNKCIWMISHI